MCLKQYNNSLRKNEKSWDILIILLRNTSMKYQDINNTRRQSQINLNNRKMNIEILLHYDFLKLIADVK